MSPRLTGIVVVVVVVVVVVLCSQAYARYVETCMSTTGITCTYGDAR